MTRYHDGKDFRELDQVFYSVGVDDSVLSEDETARAGIPTDPQLTALLEGRSSFRVAAYDLLLKSDLDDEARELVSADRADAVAYHRDRAAWLMHYKRAIEYPASRIFVALKDGTLPTKGRLLPLSNIDAAGRSELEGDDRDFSQIAVTEIPPAFWSLQGIDFDASAAGNGTQYYCHVSCNTEDMLSVFPVQGEHIDGVFRVGDSFVLSESSAAIRSPRRRGRPSYPWEAFYLEVTALCLNNSLPKKKEAAIEHLRNWFEREYGVKASRSVVGEKLKPYYDKFVKRGGQKIV